MATVTIELDDAVFSGLQARAQARQVTVEALVAAAATAEATPDVAVSDDFRALTDDILNTSGSVLHRLAQ